MKGQTLLYQYNNGKIIELDKNKYVHYFIEIFGKNDSTIKLDDLLKLNYIDIIRKYKNYFKNVAPGIYLFTENNNKLEF